MMILETITLWAGAYLVQCFLLTHEHDPSIIRRDALNKAVQKCMRLDSGPYWYLLKFLNVVAAYFHWRELDEVAYNEWIRKMMFSEPLASAYSRRG